MVDGLGRAAGRAVELVVRADDPLARVARIGIRRHRQPLRWVEWRDVLTFEKSGVQLCPEAVIRASDEPGSSTDLWLRRDVLDTQILDAQGGRLDALSHAQLAALVAQVPSARASELLSAVGPHRAADALSLAHPDVSSRLVGALPHPFATCARTHAER